MLLSHIANGNLLPFAVHNGNAKQFLFQENAFCVMTQGSMSEVREEGFRFVEPVVNREIVSRSSTELPRAALCVLEWVGHNLHLVGGSGVILKAVVALHR